MEQHNRTDKILREKFEGFTPEPSDRVWQAVRTQMPTPKRFWGYDLLGAGLVTLTAGFFILHFSTQSIVQPSLPASEPIAQLDTKTAPAPSILNESDETVAAEVPDETAETAVQTLDASEKISAQTVPFKPVRAKASDNQSLPTKVIAQPTKVITPAPSVKTVIPKEDKVIPAEKPVITPNQTQVVENKTPVTVPAIQQGENMLIEGRQTDRSKIIKKVSDIAEKNLGIETEYTEKKYDDYTKTSFSADFKLIKIKRVKTRKND